MKNKIKQTKRMKGKRAIASFELLTLILATFAFSYIIWSAESVSGKEGDVDLLNNLNSNSNLINSRSNTYWTYDGKGGWQAYSAQGSVLGSPISTMQAQDMIDMSGDIYQLISGAADTPAQDI